MSRRRDAQIAREVGGHIEGHGRGAHATAEEHRRWRAANRDRKSAYDQAYRAKRRAEDRLRRAALAYVLEQDPELARAAVAVAVAETKPRPSGIVIPLNLLIHITPDGNAQVSLAPDKK